ncbi:lysozyme [Sphingomonas oligophenolica]|uniref:Lysozyme n=1 Tax=Sphingomonas oligophenolica TaxID=301154 RepID=A0ABU9Y6V2_9SPHN
MIHSQAARDLIARFEGRRRQAYPDPATGGDPWTIGVGHTGPEVRKGLIWDDARIDAALDADLKRFDQGVTALLDGAPTTQNEFDALVSFAFNLGLASLARSSLIRRHKAGDFEGAATVFAKWNKARGETMAGLTRRRAAEADLYGRHQR